MELEKFKKKKEREENERIEKTKKIIMDSIGYEFKNSKFLMEAVTHTKSSYLSTMGDSVLGKGTVGQKIFKSPGKKTREIK